MPSDSGPADLLGALSVALAGIGCRWYLFGAQAVIVWGRPRLTTDVDITVDIGSGATEHLVSALTVAGFQLTEHFSDEFVRVTRVLPFFHSQSAMALDVVLAGPGLEEQFLDRAQTVDIAGTRVPVISAEDLVVTKTLAGRSKDLDDIRGVIQTRGATLDLDYVRRTLALLEEALGQSDLIATFEAALTQATRRGP